MDAYDGKINRPFQRLSDTVEYTDNKTRNEPSAATNVVNSEFDDVEVFTHRLGY